MMSEEIVHRAVWKHFLQRRTPNTIGFHPANGGARNPITGSKLKAMGVVPGVADLIFLRSKQAYALELKNDHSRHPSDEQIDWGDAWSKAGGVWGIAYGLDQALRLMTVWGVIK